MAEPFIAEIKLFGGNFAPRGWAFCDGQLLPISQNTALFSLLGTIYGGDGRTTFALPDLRGRAAIGPRHGPGLSSYREGQRGGRENVTLTINELPSHSHVTNFSSQTNSVQTTVSFKATADEGTTDESENNIFASGISKMFSPANAPDQVNLAPVSGNIIGNATSLNTGNQRSFSIQNPFLAINYIIALVGIFPSRS